MSVLLKQALGWSVSEVEELQALMFDKSDAWGREGCTAEQVTWSDVQHVFRTAWSRTKGLVVAEGWSEVDEEMFPVLRKKNRLQYRIQRHSIRERVLGSWRMYCEAGHTQPMAKLHREGAFDVLFKSADSSGSGTLDQGEIQKVLGWDGLAFSLGSVDEVLSRYDGSGDGVLNYWEFVELMKEHCVATTPEQSEKAVSYGLVISEFEDEALTFAGRSRVPGVFEVVDGKASYAEGGCQHVVLSYCEVYPDGARKLVSARLKSNGKFQCTREDGRKQKGRREDSCTAALERGEKDVIKYFEGELEVFENAKKRRQLAVKVPMPCDARPVFTAGAVL